MDHRSDTALSCRRKLAIAEVRIAELENLLVEQARQVPAPASDCPPPAQSPSATDGQQTDPARTDAPPLPQERQLQDTIEELRVTEEELLAANAELRSANERMHLLGAAADAERRRYQSLFDLAPDGYLVTDAEGTIQTANAAAGAMLECDPATLAGKPLPLFLPPGSLGQCRRMLEDIRAGEGARQWETVMLTGGHRTFAAALHATAERGEAGEPLTLRWLVRDVSQRKRAEEAVRESEARFRTMADGLPLIVWVHDARGEQQYVNRTFQEFLGVSEEQARGPGWQVLMHPDDADAYAGEFFACVRDRRPFHGETRVRCADGQWRWIESWGRPRFSASGEYLGFVGTSADLTERKQAEQALRELNETLEQRVAERTAEAERRAAQLRALTAELARAEQNERRRLATLLHDHLQQLLVGTKFHLGVLRGDLSDSKSRESLKQIDNLLDESLDASRTLTVELCPPIMQHGTMAQVLQWLAQWFGGKHGLNVEVVADPHAHPHDYEVRVLLLQAVRELLFNTIKHAGVSRACVELSRAGNEQVQVVVSDHGCGFDPSAAGMEVTNGSGFGLFNIRERLDWLGGRIEIESAIGDGTRTTILVPVCIEGRRDGAEVSSATATPAAHEPSQGEAGSNHRVRILLADDHAVMRESLARMLGMQSWIEIAGQASDGREVIDLAARLQPDVVIMDINMPHVDGVEATRRILTHRANIKIIGLSMSNEDGVAAAMKNAGAVCYLAKPAGPGNLLAAIRQCTGVTSGPAEGG